MCVFVCECARKSVRLGARACFSDCARLQIPLLYIHVGTWELEYDDYIYVTTTFRSMTVYDISSRGKNISCLWVIIFEWKKVMKKYFS